MILITFLLFFTATRFSFSTYFSFFRAKYILTTLKILIFLHSLIKKVYHYIGKCYNTKGDENEKICFSVS